MRKNAVIKAKAICEMTGALVLADDSGFEVDYLNGEPGIYSARYLGEDTSYDIKMPIFSNAVKACRKKKRDARFVCVIACAYPDGNVITTKGVIEGKLAHEPKGTHGFGYDPIFLSAGARLHNRRIAAGGEKIRSATAVSHSARWLKS